MVRGAPGSGLPEVSAGKGGNEFDRYPGSNQDGARDSSDDAGLGSAEDGMFGFREEFAPGSRFGDILVSNQDGRNGSSAEFTLDSSDNDGDCPLGSREDGTFGSSVGGNVGSSQGGKFEFTTDGILVSKLGAREVDEGCSLGSSEAVLVMVSAALLLTALLLTRFAGASRGTTGETLSEFWPSRTSATTDRNAAALSSA